MDIPVDIPVFDHETGIRIKEGHMNTWISAGFTRYYKKILDQLYSKL